MKTFVVLVTLWLSGILAISAQEDNNSRYIEVTGSSETEIIPDEIHHKGILAGRIRKKKQAGRLPDQSTRQ